ncbi:MAG TPA: 50S ribosomal protein L9 [Blastocatellia bacterium]|nr:50S ribosomal protein L9 [Blastocatellia bacterium]
MAHMDVLLKEDVDNLGHRGQVVRVRAGYGRNYLLPQGLAIEASAGNKRMIEEERRALAKREERERVAAQSEFDKLNGLELRFHRRVGEHGLLYGSVTSLDVVEALKAQGFTVERRKVALKDHIKEVGEYDVQIKLHREVTPTIKVKVLREGEEELPAAEEAPATESALEASSTAEAAPEGEAQESSPETPGASFVAADEAEAAQE